MEVTGRPILDKEGKVKEVFSIQTDVTKNRLLQDQWNRERQISQKKMTAAVIRAQEQERSELGKELHDNVNQILTTVKLYLELGMNADKQKELTRRAIELLQNSISEIRGLSQRLSAPSTEKKTLDKSVKE